MTHAPLVRLEDVHCNFKVKQGLFRFKNYPILRGISLSIHEGETLGVIGHNGASKSTLMRGIADIIRPDKGSIVFDRDVSALLLHLRIVFDHELSGRDNAIISSMLLGFSRKQAIKKVPEIFQYAELERFIDDPLKTYSTGMRMRLGFSISMLMSSGILHIDEIFGVRNQDFRTKSVRSMKRKLVSKQTAVVVSHYMNLIQQICNRVVWVEIGASAMKGPTAEVVDAYEEPLEATSCSGNSAATSHS